MHCLKCGTEIQSPAVFCDRCLADMEKHPVSRETPAVIPPRPAYNAAKRNRRPPKPEELLAQSRKQQRRLVWISGILTVLCLTLGALLFIVFENWRSQPVIGQNYIADVAETTAATETTEARP